jgi:hypothetical protein
LPRLSAIEALGRGFANVRANWELLPLQLAALLLGVTLTIASMVPLVIALGLTLAEAKQPAELLERVLDPATWLSGGVLASLAGCLLLGGLVIGAYAWFQAGIFGVLVAGDRQAGPGPRRPRVLFRTFSWNDFAGWAGRRFWRLVGWYHYYFLLLLLLVGLFGILLIGSLRVGLAKGAAAGIGVGCGGLLPLVFVFLFCSLLAIAAKADVVREDSGARESWTRAAKVVGRRLGGGLLLMLLLFVVSLAISMALMPFQFFSQLALRQSPFAGFGVSTTVSLVQSCVGVVLGLVYAAAFVALVRAELPDRV